MKKNYSKVTIISLSILSLVLGVGVLYLITRPDPSNPKLEAPGCQIERVQNVPTSTPIMIPPNRPFVLTLVNKNTSEVDVIVTINGATGGPINLDPIKIPAPRPPAQGYYLGVNLDNYLQPVPGVNYTITLKLANPILQNVYSIFHDNVVIAH